MWSNQMRITINCLLILSAIVAASGQAQHYNGYHNPYGRQQLVYQYDQPPEKTPPHQYLASAPAPFPSAQAPFPAQAPISLSSRQSQALITQIVEGSEQFTFDMIYVSSMSYHSQNIFFSFAA